MSERFLAPVAVLGLHVILLADVLAHRRRLRNLHDPLVAFEWALAAIAILAYLRTVISDPGFLSNKPRPVRPSVLGRALGAAVGCLALPFSLCRSARTVLGVSGGTSSPGTASKCSSSAYSATRDASEERELQPIGRAAFDALGQLEAGSDPGEECIDVADLEGGVSSGVLRAGELDDGRGEAQPPGVRLKRRDPSTTSGASGSSAAAASDRQHVQQSGHRLRFCKVCSMHQPLRTKHCRDCGRCVRTHDHHCPWIGTCVGEGNRVYFFWFLVAQCLELAVFFCEGAVGLWEGGSNPALWFVESVGLCLGMVAIGLLLLMVSCLLSFHAYLAASNLTTWEHLSWHAISYLRSLTPEDGSPFSRSLKANLAAYCCPPGCLTPLCTEASGLKRTEDGWAVWELGEQHLPLEVSCSACGCMEGKCNLCSCFEVT